VQKAIGEVKTKTIGLRRNQPQQQGNEETMSEKDWTLQDSINAIRDVNEATREDEIKAQAKSSVERTAIDLLLEIHAERIRLAHCYISKLEKDKASLTAELSAKVAPLVYDREKPTQAGWYWHRDFQNHERIVHVWEIQNRLMVAIDGTKGSFSLESFAGEFAGPITQRPLPT
jgi:hypothetical protein